MLRMKTTRVWWLCLSLLVAGLEETQSAAASSAAPAAAAAVTSSSKSVSGLHLAFRSCSDVLHASTTRGQAPPADGEYLLVVTAPPPAPSVAVSVYCAGFSTGAPREYLTLNRGRSNNFAENYRITGDNDHCQKKFPETFFVNGGRSEFFRIGLNLTHFLVDTHDQTFAVLVFGKAVNYGTAGDLYSRDSSCGPMGQFSVDVRGTPFALAPGVSWRWNGSYADGSTNGQPVIRQTAYVGCFEDAPDRLLPTNKLTSASGKSHLSPATCTAACAAAGFTYAGVENGEECWCGDSYSKHQRSAESQCNLNCKGDRSQSCGGNWRIAVYATDTGQTVTGRCGGYPGKCFPVVGSASSQPALQLVLSPKQPCLHGACQQSEACVALTEGSFKCLPVCNGTACDTSQTPVVSNSVDCPMGQLAVQCACATSTCTGARFHNNRCLSSTGKSRVSCLHEDPGHVVLTDVEGKGRAQCPNGTALVGCSYWDAAGGHRGDGTATRLPATATCSVAHCATCTAYARCQAYVCGCENGATCDPLTGQCHCPPGYYGDQCHTFDYCTYYEDHQSDHSTACSAGTCQAVPSETVRTFGAGAADTCVFPFDLQTTAGSLAPTASVTYTQCVSDNLAGPPFACGTSFDGVDDYVDLGVWSPGPVYTLAAWVSPAITDNTRRIILGSGWNCRDFGLTLQGGRFNALYSPTNKSACTANLQGPAYVLNKWYLVAAANNGTHLSLYVDSSFQTTRQVRPFYLPTSEAFRIGNSKNFPNMNFKGYIKSVMVWKRSLGLSEIKTSMSAAYNASTADDGLVGHYELGSAVNLSCQGTDHGGDHWTLLQDTQVSGVHCNVNRLTIGQGITVQVMTYNGQGGGFFQVYAEEIHIDGYLTAEGRGYAGGQPPTKAGANGVAGESYHSLNGSQTGLNLNVHFYQPHRGGGGGGQGGAHATPGGGGGYGQAGSAAQRSSSGQKGQGGQPYGSAQLERLYLGSGGGSGGTASDLTHNPPGGGGGAGGGAVGLYARGSVLIHGHVSVAGQDGQGDVRQSSGCKLCPAACRSGTSLGHCYSNSSSACWDSSGSGGGGSGGSLYIRGSVVDVGWDRLWVQGGSGGLGGAGGCGGDGGSGRVRVDAVTFRGQLPDGSLLVADNSTTAYQDLSEPAQKQIRYSSALVNGNEVFRGCFEDPHGHPRHFAFSLPVPAAVKRLMTPTYCMEQCRQRGYAFSAVEYGYECYCDNAFNSTLLRHESDCSQACAGDPQQVCGGSYRMSVYGPKSFLPARAYNGALQQCRPWCLTGNLYSSKPSWGYCDLSSANAMSYNIRCQCPAGFQGANCDQACPQGSWGLNCLKVCICNKTASLGCHPQDGTCDCRPGYEGSTCDVACTAGYFGHKCSGHCSCPETSDCDFVTGECKCKDGWKGPQCQFPCQAGTYGAGCSGHCQCFQGSCAPEDGHCSCDPGYQLPQCVLQCDPGTYGPNCRQMCDCHGQSCDPVTGSCKCGPGFAGRRCEKLCPHGTYGQNCGDKCPCQNEGGCDPVDGECDCTAGWTGENCTRSCNLYKYGQDCADHCVCLQQNSEACDGVLGTCFCKPGFTGGMCQIPCPRGYFGIGCGDRCDCYNNATCDKRTGQCLCDAGSTGPQCQTACASGTYGANCTNTCAACASPGVCSKDNGTCICTGGTCSSCPAGFHGNQCQQVCQCVHGACDPGSGVCQGCDPGWQGPQCDTPCAAGSWGKQCLSACQCQHGNCSAVDGTCSCHPGYFQKLCNTPCSTNTFGLECSGNCEPCGPGAISDSCNPVTGRCDCRPGYTGALCDRPCPENMYGAGCNQQCSCINGDCDIVDGSCECSPGFTGDLCDQQCADNMWGPDCRNPCICSGHWTSCDHSTGQCQCAAGFTGVLCRQTCAAGTFGTNCADECTCDLSVSQCSPVDGSCFCQPGFLSPNCTLCPLNTFGQNCTEKCDCSDHGSCDNHGACDCAPGYIGDVCQTPCEQDAKWGKGCATTCDCSGQHCDFQEGTCRCDPGKTGQRCDRVCDTDHYGFECGQLCQCKDGAACDPESGECRCPSGVDGRYCNHTCPVGRYGAGCSLLCACAAATPCDRTSGRCRCQPGVTGPACNVSCPAGTWDVHCAMKCSPTCGTTGCLPDTGQCKCTAASCPAHYTCMSSGLCDIAQQGQQGNSPTASSTGGLGGGQVAGIVVGVVVAVVVVALAVLLVKQRHNSAVLQRLSLIFRTGSNGQAPVQGTDNPLYSQAPDPGVSSLGSLELEERSSSES